MTPKGLRSRVLVFLLGVTQVALPPAMSVVDAILSRGETSQGAHFEDPSEKHCTPTHSGDCTVCRYLSNAMARPATPSYLDVASRTTQAAVRLGLAPSAGPERIQPPSRAPPAIA
jgi:hypothetical protein